ncbi:ENTH/VHS family protein [Forsythia ovata]|uniref:ENTH/VHS family protein n=1 Tax=Forsythia ovata TaxID=205694 RepID=A0ABD1X8D5_9LAMI
MGSFMHEFKRQASFFLKEKIKTARLVLTDVTPVQILTEEITNGDSMAANTHAMRLISRAAFEVDDYERIVHILHERLSKFDTWNWRASYKALILLEHLLTHGPQRVADEFESDQDVIREMESFRYVDEKGFNWGLSVQKKSERILNLLEDGSYLKEEREKARKLTFGIKGFGSFGKWPAEASLKEVTFENYLRSNSLFNGHYAEELASNERTNLLAMEKAAKTTLEYVVEEDHPFWEKEHQTRVSLLSSV